MPVDNLVMIPTRVNSRLLVAAAVVALVIALVSLITRALVASAISWLFFEVFVILSAIFITTPKGAAVQEQNKGVAPPFDATPTALPVEHSRTAKIYRSTAYTNDLSFAEMDVRDEDVP